MRRDRSDASPRAAADPGAVAFSGRTDAVSAGLVRDADAAPATPDRGRRPPRLKGPKAGRRRAAAGHRLAASALGRSRESEDGDLGTEALHDLSRAAAGTAAGFRRRRRTATSSDGNTAPAEAPAPEALPASRHDTASGVPARPSAPKEGGVVATPRGTPALGRNPRRGAHARGRARRARARRVEGAIPAPARSGEGTAAGRGLAGALPSAAAPLAGILAGVVAVLLATTLASQAMGSLFGMWSAEDARSRGVAGLPPYITYEMVEAALECQEEYGHPAGCTIAQIIVESGCGDHLSGLATRDNNLFGIKWDPSFALCPEVTGKDSWQTQEEYGGQSVTIVDAFTRFTTAVDCITFRSRVFLQAPRYAGNESIRQAISGHDSDLMARGLKEAGWATSSEYVALLTSVMDTYDLRRFDSMTPEDLAAGADGASGSQIVAAATSQLGVPYVWGGTTPGVGLDCSGLTQWCYRQAGIEIPRTANAQHAAGLSVPLSEARPGDILWRDGHVAIYVGDDTYIHAPKPGDVVKVSHGKANFTCAVRFP